MYTKITIIRTAILMMSLAMLHACTPMKRMQTGMARAIGGSETIMVGNHEVYCSQGSVCSEVDVLAVQAEDRDGGKVRVVFKNRTGNTALFQVRLEIRDAQGMVLTETRPENVSIPPTQEKSYEMPGVGRKGASVRVILSTAY